MITQRPIYPIIAYEVQWTGNTPTVHPVTVTRHGILPECKGVTVDVTYLDGRKAQASPEMFFDTRLDALNQIDDDLGTALRKNIEAQAQLKKNYRELVQQAMACCDAIIKEQQDD